MPKDTAMLRHRRSDDVSDCLAAEIRAKNWSSDEQREREQTRPGRSPDLGMTEFNLKRLLQED
jgi:hypothetical protein